MDSATALDLGFEQDLTPRFRVPFLGQVGLVAAGIVRELALLAFRPKTRTEDQVGLEYDVGSWRAMLESRAWEKYLSLEAFLVSSDLQSDRVVTVDDSLVRMSTTDYYRLRLKAVQRIIEANMVGDSLVEIGSGFGLNLFSVALANKHARLAGYDISVNGVTAARMIAKHFGVSNVSFDIHDLITASDAEYRRFEGSTVLSYLCLEQLGSYTEHIIQKLLRSGARRMIHVETTYELLRRWSPRDWLSYLYVRRMDYITDLLATLRRFEQRGALRILRAERLNYSPTIRNTTTLIVWEPMA